MNWKPLVVGDSHYEYAIDDRCIVLRVKDGNEKVWIRPIILPKLEEITDKELRQSPKPTKKGKEGRTKYWDTMCDILDRQFPKGECQERGRALVMLSFIEMMLQGVKFKDGKPRRK